MKKNNSQTIKTKANNKIKKNKNIKRNSIKIDT